MKSIKQKIERQKSGPRMAEVVIAAVLGVVLGVAIAAVHLILQPVREVKALPDDAPKGTVFYIKGSHIQANGAQWMRKRQLFLAQQTVQIPLNEDELNAWISATMRKPNDKEPAVIKMDMPDFRIADDLLQVAVPTKLTVFGTEFPILVQTRGKFVNSADGPVFKPEAFYFGSLPVMKIPGVPGWLEAKFRASGAMPDEFIAAWKKLSDVRVIGRYLQLTMP